MRLGARQRSQAVVEFGLIALLFTLMIFAIVDFGLLLNTWLAITSGSRDLARDAAVGHQNPYLQNAAQQINVPSVSTAGGWSSMCCTSNSALEVKVEYFDGQSPSCKADPLSCPIGRPALDSNYPVGDLGGQTGGCGSPPCPHPMPDDVVKVTIIAHGAQVITPLVRPFFGCTDGTTPVCNVKGIQSMTVMRFEGQEF